MNHTGFETSPRRTVPKVIVYLLAIVGGVAGTAAAFYQNMANMSPLLLFVAPVVEELCKPIGLIIMLDKRPRWVDSRTEVVVLALLAAAVFATLENLLYIFVNAPGMGTGYAIFRFTVPTSMHLIATGVFAVGIGKGWERMRNHGGRFDIDVCFRYYLAAVVIHAAYNGVALLLVKLGVLKF